MGYQLTHEQVEKIVERIDTLIAHGWSRRKIQKILQIEGYGWIGNQRMEDLQGRVPVPVKPWKCPTCRTKIVLYPCLICQLKRRKEQRKVKL